MHKEIKKPSVMNYFIAAFIALGGIVGFIIILAIGLTKVGDQPNYLIPGQHTLELEKEGKYTIFHEYYSQVGNKIINTDQSAITGLECHIISEAGDTLAVRPTMANSTYSFGNRQGYGILTFKVATPGTYTLDATLPEDSEETVLTISHSFMSGLMFTILGSLALLFGAGAIALVILIMTIMKHINYNKQEKNRTSPASGSF